MYKYRIIGFFWLIIAIVICYFNFNKLLNAFSTHDLHSIGFASLMYLIPLEYILLNQVPYLYWPKEKMIDYKWRLRVEGKTFYKSSLIKYIDFLLMFLILVSAIVLAIGIYINNIKPYF